MKKYSCTLTVFVGDIDEGLSIVAKSHDPLAYLVDHSNYKSFLVSPLTKDTTVYTSLGDLPKNLEVIYSILELADRIIYSPPEKWSDNQLVDFVDPGTSVQGLTEILLMMLPESIRVENLILQRPDPILLVDSRKSNQPQLWSIGCSITHGVGVDSHQRYGQLLADELTMSSSFLTRPGSAIDWAADQILRSDIRKNDIVVWGLTNPERLTYIHDNTLLLGITPWQYEVNPDLNNIINSSNLYSQNTIYKHLYAIQQVINYCKKCGANLILSMLMFGSYSLLSFLKTQKNYAHIPCPLTFKNFKIENQFIDLGSDNSHPGPKQHYQYKTIILDKIKELKMI